MNEEDLLEKLDGAGLNVKAAGNSWSSSVSMLAVVDAVGRDGGNALIKIDGGRADGQVYTVMVSGGRLGDSFLRKDGADLQALLREVATLYASHVQGDARNA